MYILGLTFTIQSQGHEVFEKEVEVAFKKSVYIGDKKPVIRGIEPMKVLTTLSEIMKKPVTELSLVKYVRSEKSYKGLAAISLKIFCDMTLREMTEHFRGYTTSSISHLVREGYRIISRDGLYKKLAVAISN